MAAAKTPIRQHRLITRLIASAGKRGRQVLAFLSGDLGLLAGSLVVAAFSLLLPSGLGSDPAQWVLWGKEIDHLSLSTAQSWTAWKPGAVLFTQVFGLFGEHASTLWMFTSRTGCVMAIAVAFRLTAQLVRNAPVGQAADRRLPALIAGGTAAVWVLLVGDVHLVMFGFSEGLLVALGLLSVDRALRDKPREAILFGLAAGLFRPEFMIVPAWLVLRSLREDRQLLKLMVFGAAAVVAAWLIPDWIGSGDALNNPHIQSAYIQRYPSTSGGNPLRSLEAAGAQLRKFVLLVLPLGCVVAWTLRGKGYEQPFKVLTAGAVGLIPFVAGAALGGPVVGRFAIAADALFPIVSACGIGVSLAYLSGRLAAGSLARAAFAAFSVAAFSALGVLQLARVVPKELTAGQTQQQLFDGLAVAIRAAGGPAAVVKCGEVVRLIPWDATITSRLGLRIEQLSRNGGPGDPLNRSPILDGTYFEPTPSSIPNAIDLDYASGVSFKKLPGVSLRAQVGQWRIWQRCAPAART